MFRKAIWFFPILFVLELVFGGAGTLIMIGSIAIRHILFILTFICLYGYMVYDLICTRTPIYSKTKKSFLGNFTKTDIFAVFFEFSMLLSMTIIPYVMGTNLSYAKSEVFDSVAVFSLFFAVSYLIKNNRLSLVKVLCFLKYVIALFGLEHLILYFGQEINGQFIERFFENIVNMFGGNGIVPRIILGHGGYTRVMFNTSIYLLVGIFIFFYQFNKNKWHDYIVFAIELLAMITTVTKSIWLGAAVSFMIIIILLIVFGLKTNRKTAIKALCVGVFSLGFILLMDHLVFDNIVKIRMTNAFVLEVNTNSDKSELENLDAEGAAKSNSIKMEQIGHLLDKWKESPILGHGYGSYVEDYLRSKEAPFSYEMQLFALLMKIGILGLLIWILFFVVQFVEMVWKKKTQWMHVFAWLFLLIAFVLCVQTNPLLISFTGMSVVLLLSLITIDEIA